MQVAFTAAGQDLGMTGVRRLGNGLQHRFRHVVLVLDEHSSASLTACRLTAIDLHYVNCKVRLSRGAPDLLVQFSGVSGGIDVDKSRT